MAGKIRSGDPIIRTDAPLILSLDDPLRGATIFDFRCEGVSLLCFDDTETSLLKSFVGSFFVICFRADQRSSSSLKALYKGVDGVIQTAEGSQPSNVTKSVSGGFLGDIHGDHGRRNEKKT